MALSDEEVSGRDQSQLTPDGTPVELAWDYFDDDQPPKTTRELLRQRGNGVAPIKKPVPIPPPKRIFTEPQMTRLRLGHKAEVMEDHWHTLMEGNTLFHLRSWTGFTIYEAHLIQTRAGWRIKEAFVEGDFEFYVRSSQAYESAALEYCTFGCLGKYDAKLEGRWEREMSKWYASPKIVITKAKGPPMPIAKPGYSVKHGTLADQHPLQRDEYDKAYGVGYKTARDALIHGKRTAHDVFYSAHRHEERALITTGLESSRHAGLAKGAKMAAYLHHHEGNAPPLAP